MNEFDEAFDKTEEKFRLKLPAIYRQLFSLEEFEWEIGPYFFIDPDSLLGGHYHMYDMTTGLIPIAKNNGDFICLLYREREVQDPPVAAFLAETADIFPIASSLRGLLWFSMVFEEVHSTKYFKSETRRPEDLEHVKNLIARMSESLGIPYEFGQKPFRFGDKCEIVEEDRVSFHREFVKMDPLAPQSLCFLSKAELESGDIRSAQKHLVQATEAVPGFAAPHYFHARLHEDQGRKREAFEEYWRAASGLLACSGFMTPSTEYEFWTFDLGIGSEGYEEGISCDVFSRLRSDESLLFDIAGGDPLAGFIVGHEPLDIGGRKTLAEKYQDLGLLEKALREWDNVYYLSETKEDSILSLTRLIAICENLGYEAAAATQGAYLATKGDRES